METACGIAAKAGAHLEGFHVKIDPVQVMMWAGDGLGSSISGEWIDRMEADASDLAAKARAAFIEVTKRHAVPMADGEPGKASAAWRVETGLPSELVASRARFFDLVVLGRSERVIDKVHSDTIEQTLVHSGRPVLLAPATPPSHIGETIALGWNGSAEAVHAVAAAMPLIACARRVHIISIGKKAVENEQGLRDHLSWHGVTATYHTARRVEGASAGGQLLSLANEQGADLLVMGAYGHRPWREILFGGATREVVGNSFLPVLLMH
jgi:nucleotide-binding universal stress UspA family protein